ncbi:MAG: ATP-binding protein [Gemmatimonadota bacterium]
MSLRAIRDRTYAALAVAPPGDGLARLANLFIALLILVNAAAVVAARWLTIVPGVYFDWFRWASAGLYAIEYLLRLWAAPAGMPEGTRLRRLRAAAHPLAVADLLAILSALPRPWLPFDLRLLRLLRLPPIFYLLRRTGLPATRPEGKPAFEAQVVDVEAALAEVRGRLTAAEDEDVRQVRDHLDGAANQIRVAQRRWLVARRHDASAVPEAARLDGDELRAAMDQLLARLQDPDRLAAIRQRHREVCELSRTAFEGLPEPAWIERDLRWQGRKVYRPVPLAHIGQAHFRDLPAQQAATFEQFLRTYTEGAESGVASARAAVQQALSLAARSHEAGADVQVLTVPAEVQISFDRALNRCRDLEERARSSWEALRWDLEREHGDRLERVTVDGGRFGRFEYYLGKLARGAVRQGGRLLALVRQAAAWAAPLVTRKVREVHAAASEVLLPALRFLGLARAPVLEQLEALDQARLGSLEWRQIPADYRAHFRFEPLEADELAVGFERELASIDQAVQRWEAGRTSSFVVFGERGSGKTTLLNIAQARLFDRDDEVVRHTIERKLVTPEALTPFLGQLLGLADVPDVDALATALLAAPRRAIILEGCHNLYMRRIGGLEAIRHLLWLVARTNQHVLWGLCLEKNARHYLARWLPFERLLHFEVGIRRRRPRELRSLIMQRHNRSGCRLRFLLGPDQERAVRRRVKRWRRPDEPAVQEALAQIYFEELAAVCGENVIVAFFYWLRSIRPVEPDTYEVQPMEALRLDLVRAFSLDQAFVLAAVLQHDNLTAEELASTLDTDPIQTRLELEILVNQSILEMHAGSGRFRLNPVALKPVAEMLEGRNLVY